MSGKRDSNPRRQPWQGCTLPLSYSRIMKILRAKGLEPPRRKAPDPKSGVSASSTTLALLMNVIPYRPFSVKIFLILLKCIFTRCGIKQFFVQTGEQINSWKGWFPMLIIIDTCRSHDHYSGTSNSLQPPLVQKQKARFFGTD